MAIVRFDPIGGFNNLAKKMNDIFDFDKGISVEYGGFAPRIDILEDENNLYFQAEMPGINKDDVKVKINEEGMICITGEKKRETNENVKNTNYQLIRSERSYGSFSRAFILPENADKSSIKAKFENGILQITLKKVEPEKRNETHIVIEW